jgi:hypothetical protein
MAQGKRRNMKTVIVAAAVAVATWIGIIAPEIAPAPTNVSVDAPVVSEEEQARLRQTPTGSGDCNESNVMSGGATNCPLLTASDIGITSNVLDAEGYYKIDTALVDERLLYGGLAMTTGDPTKVWVNTGGGLGQITLPALVDSSNTALFNTATTVQAGVDMNGSSSAGLFCDDVNCENTTGAYLSAVLEITNHLIVGGFNYFDSLGSGSVDKGFFRVSKTLSAFSYPGAVRPWDGDGIVTITQAFATQYCGHTPTEWQTALGNIHYCGSSSAFPIVSRTSNGPSIIMLDLGQVNTTTVTGQGLLYYLGSGPTATLGEYSSSVTPDQWSSTAILAGCQMINNTRTMVCLGANGTGTDYGTCYGTTPTPPGDCGIPMDDPEYQGIGYHAPPYRYKYWLYDLNDLKAVKDGTGGKTHENVAPYAHGHFALAFTPFRHRLVGLTYDATNHRLHTLAVRVYGGTDRDFPAGVAIQVDITP